MFYKNQSLLGLGNYLNDEHYHNVLLLAPHGSGKTTCYAIPYLLTSDESAIVHDIKSENYILTSGYRAKIGHKIFVWNPFGGENNTNRYNPFDFISRDNEKIIHDIQKISHLLMKDNIEVKNFFVSLVLYLSAIDDHKISFGKIIRTLNNDLICKLSNEIDNLKNIIHPIGFEDIKEFLKKDIQKQNNIIETLNHYLDPWNNTLIDYATSESDFDLADFKVNKSTLYVCLNPNDIANLKSIASNHFF